MAELVVATGRGPVAPPAAAREAGLLSASPTRYSFAGEGPTRARARLRDCDLAIGTEAELVYAIYPAFDDRAEEIADGFRASAVAIDVLFDDGSRLLDHPALDQYSLAVDPRGTLSGKALVPEQWNLRRVSLAAAAGRRAIAIELVVDSPEQTGAVGGEPSGWVDGVAIRTAVPLDRTRTPAELVLTTRGSQSSPQASRGNTQPFVSVPHGFTFVTPMTDSSNAHWNYSWSAHGASPHPKLQALAVSHSPSLWIGDRGVLQVMPTLELETDARRRAVAFSHDDEVAHPHRYGVTLANGIVAETSTTEHAVLMRFDFPRRGGFVIFDQLHASGGLSFERRPGGVEVSGYIDSESPHSSALPRTFFSAFVDASIASTGLVPDPERPGNRGFVQLDPAQDAAVTVRIGTSFIGVAQARHSRELELPPGRTLDSIGDDSMRRWNELLERVAVDGATDDQLVTLYSNLYRVFLYPNGLAEPGDGISAESARYASPFLATADADTPEHTGLTVRPGQMYVNNGFWDTYRTSWPAYFLLEPERAGELLDGFVQQYRDGGWAPRWSAPGYLDSMVGTSFDAVAADAASKGIPGFSLIEAYDAALRDATAEPELPAVGRKGLAGSLFRGFVDDGVPEAVSWTLEGATNDYALFVLSDLLAADPADERHREFVANRRYFFSRALAYRRLFDPATTFFRSRERDGSWVEPFDPREWGGGYAETNAWGTAFSVPHDGAGLAELLGGAAGLEAKLDAFFAEPETGRVAFKGSYPQLIHEMVEARDIRLGMWGLSNQPAHHIPFMYLFAGAPHKTQRITREALRRLFTGSEIGQGYPGDEDNGEMSAWWFFAALGLYPLIPGSGDYVIGSPLFERMRISLPGTKQIEVIAHNQSLDNVYVQSVLVDGLPWSSLSIPHRVLARGATVEFIMGPAPSEWGSSPAARPSSLSAVAGFASLDDVTALASLSSTGGDPRPLVDDAGATVVTVGPGDIIGFEFASPQTVDLLSVTVSEPASASLTLEASTDSRDWWPVCVVRGERFRWPGQLRVFETAAPREARHWRLRVEGQVLRLSQLELLRGSQSG